MMCIFFFKYLYLFYLANLLVKAIPRKSRTKEAEAPDTKHVLIDRLRLGQRFLVNGELRIDPSLYRKTRTDVVTQGLDMKRFRKKWNP